MERRTFLSQINYLNEHDVNSYMVEADGSPFLSCTTMTYTRQAATKARKFSFQR